MTEQVETQGWPVPPTSQDMFGMNAEDAKAGIDKLNADSLIEGHPRHIHSRNHPQAKQYSEYNQCLFDIAYSDNRTPFEKIAEEATEEYNQRQADEQADRVASAKKDMDILENEHDFIPIEIPADIPEYRARSLRQQVLLAQRNISELHPILHKDLLALNAPPDKLSKLSEAYHAKHIGNFEDEQIQNVKGLIKWIIDENVKKEIKTQE